MRKTMITIGVGFLVLALSAAAGTHRPSVSIAQRAVVNGTELKAGNYQLEFDENKVTFWEGRREVASSPVRVENTPRKFSFTEIVFNGPNITEIHLGGKTVKLILAAKPEETPAANQN